MWKRLKGILPVVGIIILVYIIIRSGPGKILEVLYSMQVSYIAPAFLLIAIYLLLQNYKWKYMLDRQGIRMGYFYLMKIYMIGTFYSIATPGKLGTLIRIGYIRDKSKKSLGECSSSVVIDKVIDIISLFAIAIIGIALFAGYMLDMMFIGMTIGLFIAFFAALFFFMKRQLSARVMRIIYRFIVPGRLKANAREAFEHFYRNMPRVWMLIIPLMVSILSWVLSYTATYLVAVSLGINIPYHMFVVIFPISTLISLIPITIGGWGTREAALIGLFSPFGVEAGSIVAMSIVSFILSSLVPAIVGAGFSLKEK